ncbi:MAG: hypothetical protein LBH13_10680 [Cellulomonadaceae bacterium]|jgi:predicted secreted protein|nr:hypothetical protein [Cellulomonadaceae bacterium]
MFNPALVLPMEPTITIDVTPNRSLPFIRTLETYAGSLQTVMLIILGICLLLGIGAWIVGRVTSSPNMQRVTGTVIVTCLVAAALTGSAFTGVMWATGISIFDAA